jgi:hypothetical protein
MLFLLLFLVPLVVYLEDISLADMLWLGIWELDSLCFANAVSPWHGSVLQGQIGLLEQELSSVMPSCSVNAWLDLVPSDDRTSDLRGALSHLFAHVRDHAFDVLRVWHHTDTPEARLQEHVLPLRIIKSAFVKHLVDDLSVLAWCKVWVQQLLRECLVFFLRSSSTHHGASSVTVDVTKRRVKEAWP